MKYIIAAALLAALLGTAGCGNSGKSDSQPAPAASSAPQVHTISKESEDLYVKAVTAYGKGDRLSALELANRALEKDSKNYKALSLKGIIQAFDVSPEEGIKTINQSLSINPSYVQAFLTWPWPRNWESIMTNPSVISKRYWTGTRKIPGPGMALPPATQTSGISLML